MADIKAEVDQLVHDLRDMGLVEPATRIEDAVSAGSTGSEILYAVRQQLLEFLRTNRELKSEFDEKSGSSPNRSRRHWTELPLLIWLNLPDPSTFTI